ncbi:MAG: dihydroxy-acid dehydratase, partial [bacterium]
PIALVEEGDTITIDADRLLLELAVDDGELKRRKAAWTEPAPKYTSGVLWKYSRLVSSAARGAVTG